MDQSDALVLDIGMWFGHAVKKVGQTNASRVLAIAAHGAAKTVGASVAASNRSEIAQLLRQAADAWERV